ncbi:MAG: EamA family transporter, partial [Gammaproteobacteria bacterium]|nr:EamA family transporter [Gammaproteobacteria bacterium]
VYRSPIGAQQLLGIAITMVGVVVVVSQGTVQRLAELAFSRGDLIALVAFAIYAGYAVGLRRRPPVAA